VFELFDEHGLGDPLVGLFGELRGGLLHFEHRLQLVHGHLQDLILVLLLLQTLLDLIWSEQLQTNHVGSPLFGQEEPRLIDHHVQDRIVPQRMVDKGDVDSSGEILVDLMEAVFQGLLLVWVLHNVHRQPRQVRDEPRRRKERLHTALDFVV